MVKFVFEDGCVFHFELCVLLGGSAVADNSRLGSVCLCYLCHGYDGSAVVIRTIQLACLFLFLKRSRHCSDMLRFLLRGQLVCVAFPDQSGLLP